MNYIILGLLFFLSGFFMKFSDDGYDLDENRKIAVVFGILCAVVSGMAAVSDAGAAYVFISILVGNLLAFKVDGIHHIITLLIFVIICLVFNIPELSLVILMISILAALGDEVGHELLGDNNGFIGLFFEYRFLMKIVIFILALYGAFSFYTFIFFILFEVAYEFSGEVYKKIS